MLISTTKPPAGRADWRTHIDNVAAKRDTENLDVVIRADLSGTGV
jgi:hypothetical protein